MNILKIIKEHVDFIFLPEIKKNHFFVTIFSVCFVFFATFIVTYLFAPLEFDPHHQGLLLQGANSFLEGKMLYKDVYYHYGPLTAMIHALSLYFGGLSLYSMQIATVLFYSLSSVFLYLIWSRFLPITLVLFSWGCWLSLAPFYIWILLPWSSDIALFFMLLSTFLLILNIETGKPHYLILTGMMVAFTFWSRQTVGLILFCSILLFIWAYFFFNAKAIYKGLVYYVAGFAMVIIIMGYWLFMNDAFTEFIDQCFYNQYDTLVERSSFISFIIKVIRSLFPFGYNSVFGENYYFNIWIFLPAVLLVFFMEVIVYVFLRFNLYNDAIRKKSWVLLAVLVISLASWCQYYPVTCIRHVFWAASPFIGIVIYYLWKTLGFILKEKFGGEQMFLKAGYFTFLFVIVAVFLIDVSCRLKIGSTRYIQNNSIIEKPTILSGIKVPYSQKVGLKVISDSIRSITEQGVNVKIESLSSGYQGKWKMYLYPFFVPSSDQNSNLSNTIILYHSSEKTKIENYHQLVYVYFYPPLLYDEGWNAWINPTATDFYLYVPNYTKGR